MTLLVLEDHQGLFVGGAVDAHAGHLQAPFGRGGAHVGEVVEISALEETLSGVGHLAFDFGLVLGMTDPRRVGDEASVLGVLQETSGENGMQGIRAHHGGGKLSMTRYLGMPPKKAHAASRPAITSASFCCCMGQTKQWRE